MVIGIGTRYSDFTTASKTLFQCPEVKFININVCELDAAKHGGLMLQGDAKATLEELKTLLGDFEVIKVIVKWLKNSISNGTKESIKFIIIVIVKVKSRGNYWSC